MCKDPTNQPCSEKPASFSVIDAAGQPLSPCPADKARQMLVAGKARLVSETPPTIQLSYAVQRTPRSEKALPDRPGHGKRLLLHICCGPCSTYSIKRLREQGFDVSGFWYNPNIHPFAEHQHRQESVRSYAEQVQLPMIWWQGYDMPAYFQAIVGHEAMGERCTICYRLRLERTAQTAQQRGFDAFTTTLLISPYQQQAVIRSVGDEMAIQYAVEFYFENLRQGWSERGHMAQEHALYEQRYCGCIYSAWEASDPLATTARRQQVHKKGVE